MSETCCIDGCVKTREDVTFFKFPNSRTLRRKWLDAISSSVKVNLDTVVCSDHFLEEEYEIVRGKKRLKSKVVPSVFVKINSTKSVHEDKINHSNENGNGRINFNNIIDKNIDNKPTNDHRQDESDRKDDEQSDTEDIVKRTQPDLSITDTESNKDIEDIITNYQIKQIRPLNREIEENRETEGHRETDENKEREISHLFDGSIEIEVPGPGEVNGGMLDDVIDVDDETEPVFIEVSVGKDGEVHEAENQDCLMLLESVQCEVDPTSLMFPDPDPDPDPDPGEDSDVVDLGEKKDDPISLLTSSDEDDVILEEPKYDTVEVSDETDEDDVPLVKLLDRPKSKKPKKSKKSEKPTSTTLSKILWGRLYEYYCFECQYKTTSKADFKIHTSTHSTVVQVCELCSYTTSSKHQYVRHKRKHKEEKKFKCHLCKYKARHNMSLIYHLKSHDNGQLVSESVFKCPKCKYQTDTNSNFVKHERICSTASKKFVCDKCSYQTDRHSDMTRHKTRRHEKMEDYDEDDDDDYVPPYGLE